MPYKDVEQNRACIARYRKAHAEELREYMRRYHRTHRTRLNANARERKARYRREHGEIVRQRARTYAATHAAQMRAKRRRHYARHREYYVRKFRQERRELSDRYLLTLMRLRAGAVSRELLEAKRIQVKVRRLLYGR